MNRILANLGSLLLSLFLAMVVWVVAVREENPIIADDLAAPIAVDLTGLDQNLSIVGQPLEQVTLRLRAPQRTWSENLRPEDFQVRADLAGLGAGRHSVPLTADYPRDEVQIVDIKPGSLVITLEPIITRQIPVEAQVIGEPAFGYEWRGTVVTPTQVTATGPASLVDEVDAAVVEVALPGVRGTVERQQPVSLRNSDGEALTGIQEVSPRTVEVAVEIARRPGYRDFSVRVPYTGAPARGYQISSIAVDPSLVTLRGSPEAFDRLPGYVETLPIELEGATEDIRARLALNLPEPLSVIGLQNIAVQIEISPIMGSRDLRLEPVIRGLDLGLTRTVPIDTVDLVVSGPLPVLDTLDGGSTQVILDLSGLASGVHSVPLQAVVPDGVTVVSLLPAAVEITLSPRPTPTATAPVTGTIPPGSEGSSEGP